MKSALTAGVIFIMITAYSAVILCENCAGSIYYGWLMNEKGECVSEKTMHKSFVM